jgi:serine/threonine protein kinase
VLQWAAGIASAISYLETLNLAHGDLCPANILLDVEDHTKLADFDQTSQFGTVRHCVGGPFCHSQLSILVEKERDWDHHDACSGQFAFRSVLYTVDRGHEPHEFEGPGPEREERWTAMEYPALTDSAIDRVVGKCWARITALSTT